MRLPRLAIGHPLCLFLGIALVAGPAFAANHNVSVGPGNAFSPATVNINVGDTVTWTLMGGFHNVRADNDRALHLYESLGFARHCQFYEALTQGLP